MKTKIDVTIATKNNESTIKNCIENIKKYIPYKQIIIVDGNSTDRTVEIAKKLGAKIYFDGGLLGKVRYKQASLCKTEWIAIIDSDVFIYQNWWSEVSRYKDKKNIGAVYGWLDESFNDYIPSYEKYIDFYRKNVSLNKKEKYKQWGVFSFSNVLIKRNVILESKSELIGKHASEDVILAKNAVKNGHLIVPVQKSLGTHYHLDPILHCKMRYNRMGKSTVINWGKIMGLKTIFYYFYLLINNFTKYTIHSGSLDINLLKFLLILYKEFLKGAYSEIKKT